MGYRIDIDFLRFLAVMLVVIYHANIGFFKGGFVGVDVFFVISGFLMTSIIVEGLKKNDFRLISFYGNRTRRVFPVLFVFTFIVLIVSFLSLLYLYDFHTQAKLARHVVLGISNFDFARKQGYFDLDSNLQIFLHTWSLSVEIQFYLLFPVLLILIRKFAPKIKLEHIIIFLFLSSFIYSSYILVPKPNLAFYLLPARVWEFMLGSYIAIKKWSPLSQKYKQIFLFIGIFIICFAAYIYENIIFTPYPGPYALLPCLGAALYLTGGHNLSTNNFLNSTIFHSKIRLIGLMSYSVYLWHWPILVLYKNVHYINYRNITNLTATEFLGYLVITLAISYLSWKFIERPFRTKFTHYKRRSQLVALVCSIVCIVLLGNFLKKEKYFVFFDKQKSYVSFTDRSYDQLLGKPYFIGNSEIAPSFLLVGDSHAGSFISLFSKLAKEKKTSGYSVAGAANTFGGPFMHTDYWYEGGYEAKDHFNKYVRPTVEKFTFDTVYVCLYWSRYVNSADPRVDSKQNSLWNLRYEKYGEEYFAAEAVERGLEDSIEYFTSQGIKQIYLLLPLPAARYPVGANAANLILFNSEERINEILGCTKEEYLAVNKPSLDILQRMGNKYSNVELLDPTPYFFHKETDKFIVVENGKSLYSDTNHLDTFGAAKLAQLFILKP